MRINKTLAYALCCLRYMNKYGKKDWVEVSDISKFENLPLAYCNKVMQTLNHAGFVYSKKGKGFKLIKDLDDINIRDMIEAFTYNSAPDINDNNIAVKLYKNMREQIDRWLVGLTVGDVIRATEMEEK
jgi:Rrf2 family protein